LETDLEVVLGRGRFREQPPDRLDLLGFGSMGSRCDRDIHVVEVVPGANQRECLERLGRGAKRGEEKRVARLGDDRALLHRNGVYEVQGLDERATAHGYADRVHEARSVSA